MSLNEKLLEQLYLLEVLVETVTLRHTCDPGCECKHTKNQTLAVRIKFIDFPCIEITQEDFRKFDKKDSFLEHPGQFSSGKSFLFPMMPLDLIRGIRHFPLGITVLRKGTKKLKPEIIGVTRVQLTEEMVDIVRKSMVCDEPLPQSISLKETFPLYDIDCTDAGTISLFIRLSCFGQTIVTQFQLTKKKKEYLLKNSEDDSTPVCMQTLAASELADPITYDVIPSQPIVCNSDTFISDRYCCEAGACNKPFRAVSWRKADPCNCGPRPVDENRFMANLSHISRTERPTDDDPCYCLMPSEDKCVDLNKPIYVDYSSRSEQSKPCIRKSGFSTPPRSETSQVMHLSYRNDVNSQVCGPSDPNPAIRYDTTGALSPAFGRPSQGGARTERVPPGPVAVRYDMTSALSPAHENPAPTTQPTERHPSARYDTTSILSPAYNHPAVRYDTTSALTPAHIGAGALSVVKQESKHGPAEEPVLEPVVSRSTSHRLSPSQIGGDRPSKSVAKGSNDYAEKILADQKKKTVAKGKKSSPPKVDHGIRLKAILHELEAINLELVKRKRIKYHKKMRINKRFSYNLGWSYPGIKFGHKRCIVRCKPVPAEYGWFWKTGVCTYGLKYRRGWRPGAIGRSLADRVRAPPRAVRPGLLIQKAHDTAAKRKARRAQKRAQTAAKVREKLTGSSKRIKSGPPCVTEPADIVQQEPVPILHVHRVKGDVYVSLHPPHIGTDTDSVPLQFKIPRRKKRSPFAEEEEEIPTSESELEIQLFSPGQIKETEPTTKFMNTETQFYEEDVTDYLTDMILEKKNAQKHTEENKSKKKRKKKSKSKSSNAESAGSESTATRKS